MNVDDLLTICLDQKLAGNGGMWVRITDGDELRTIGNGYVGTVRGRGRGKETGRVCVCLASTRAEKRIGEST